MSASIDFRLLRLAIQIAKVPAATKRTVGELVHRLFEQETTGDEGREILQLNELKALGLTLSSATKEMEKEIHGIKEQQERISKEILALEREVQAYEKERRELYERLHKHEAAAVSASASKEAEQIRERLRKPL